MGYVEERPVIVGEDPGPERVLLRDEAYRALKALLVTGHRPPEPFLSERKLARQLGMSNTPVRSAIERLEAEGFITISPQQGIMVRELTTRDIADHYEVRQALEPFVLLKLAGQLTDEQVEQLRENLRQQEESIARHDLARLVELDTDFHLRFCEFLGNDEITRTLLQLRDKIHRVLLRVVRHAPERLVSSLPEHREIAEAVIAGDGERAAGVLREHLERGRQAMLPAGW